MNNLEKKERETLINEFLDSPRLDMTTVRKVLKELMTIDDYATTRARYVLENLVPYVTKEDISLEVVKHIMVNRELNFITDSVNVIYVNNLQGYVQIGYKTKDTDSYEHSYTIYFNDLEKEDESFRIFVNSKPVI